MVNVHESGIHRSGFLGRRNCRAALCVGCRFEQRSNPGVDAVLHHVTSFFELIFVRGNPRARDPGSVGVLVEVVLRSRVFVDRGQIQAEGFIKRFAWILIRRSLTPGLARQAHGKQGTCQA